MDLESDIITVYQQFKSRAKTCREQAREASSSGLREYYQGRADQAQAAADSLSRIVYELDKNSGNEESIQH